MQNIASDHQITEYGHIELYVEVSSPAFFMLPNYAAKNSLLLGLFVVGRVILTVDGKLSEAGI